LSIIKNTIRTLFTAEGAAGVAAATGGVTKAQTRLGQASASSGRQFAAQSQGLGGLVAAYAGAAATIFALEAAYTALSKAAEAETVLKGTNALARTIGQSGPAIVASLQKISQGQLTLAETASNANIALSAGFNTSQIEKLSKVALGASRALGRDFQDALQRVTRGAAKLEPELLDELGIFTRIDPAVRKYANTLNVSEASLTQFERRQGFVNAVIEEGERKFAAIDVTSASTQKSLEQLRVQISNLGTEFLQFIATALVPIVDFLNNNAGAALLLFGGILSLVFGKALQGIGSFATGAISSFGGFATFLANESEKVQLGFADMTASSEKFKASVSDRGGLKGTKGPLAGTGGFTGKGLSGPQATAAAQARQGFIKGDVPYAQRVKDIAALNVAQLSLTESGQKNTLAFKDARRIVIAYGAANAGASLQVKLLSGAASIASMSVKFLSKALSVAMGVANVLFAAIAVSQLVGTFFDVDILKAIKEGILGIREASEDTKTGFLGLAQAFTGNDLAQTIKDLGGSDKDLENLGQKLLKLKDETVALRNIQNVGIREGNASGTAIEEVTTLSVATDQLALRQSELNGLSADKQTAARIEIEQYKALIAVLANTTSGLETVIGQTTRLSGIPPDAVAKLFDNREVGSAIIQTADGIEVLGNKIFDLTDGATNDFNSLSPAMEKVLLAALRIDDALGQAANGFADASLDSEKLSAKLSGARTALDALIDSGEAYGENITEQTAKVAALETQLRSLQTAEKILSNIQKQFSGAFSAFDDFASKGNIGLDGTLAKQGSDALANQAIQLKAIVDRSSDLESKQIRGVMLNSEEAVQLAQGTAARKALVGLVVEQYQKNIELLRSEEQRTAELQNQLGILEAQNKVSSAQASNNYLSTVSSNTIAASEAAVALGKTNNDYLSQAVEHTMNSLSFKIQIKDTEERIALITGNSNAAQEKASLSALNNSLKTLKAERALLELRRNPGATSVDVYAQQRSNIDLERKNAQEAYQNQKAVIAAQSGANKAIADQQITSIEREQKLLEIRKIYMGSEQDRTIVQFDKETTLAEDKINADIAKNVREKAILDAQYAVSKIQIAAQKSNLEAQYQLQVSKLQGDKVFADTVNGFNDGIKLFADAVSAYLVGIDPAADVTKIREQASNLPTLTATSNTELLEKMEKNNNLQSKALDTQLNGLADVYVLNTLNNEAQSTGLKATLKQTQDLRALEKRALESKQREEIKSLDRQKELLGLKIKEVQVELAAGGVNSQAKLNELTAQYRITLEQISQKYGDLNFEMNKFQQAMLAVKDTLKSSITSALMDLNKQFINSADETRTFGEQVRDAFGGILKSVQETLFQKTIAEPVGNYLTDLVTSTGIFGKTTKGIDSVALENGAVPVVLKSATDAAVDPMAQKLEDGKNFFANTWENIKTGFNSIFGQGGTISGLVSSVFGQEGLLSTAIRGIGETGRNVFSSLGNFITDILGSLTGSSSSGGGDFLSSIIGMFSGGTPAPAMAAGGIVRHMADGGGVNGLRDRVPAMLEPGEFVLSKKAAGAIGTPGLQSMNAGGGAGGNVVVNIKNEGTPQQADASKPKFDGEKYVIDIVTRDLQNNGPIRRTMRAGG
jgi:hypothetical protein